MAKRLNITVDEEVFDFVEQYGGNNRSAFVNEVLADYRKRRFEQELIRQMAEDDADPAIRGELKDWDAALWDGMEDEESGERPSA